MNMQEFKIEKNILENYTSSLEVYIFKTKGGHIFRKN